MSAKYTFLAWDTPIENAPLKLALLQLANNADDDGFSFYSISKMAISCGMSEKTFQRKIAEMEKMEILTVERRSNRPSLYTLSGDEMGVSLCRLQNSEGTESRQGGTESRLVSDRESPVLNSYPNTPPNKENKDIVTDVPKFNFRKELLALNVDEEVLHDWLDVRKKKKAANTKTAFKGLMTEIEKSGLSAADAIKVSAENSWSGFKAQWYANLNPASKAKSTHTFENQNYKSGSF